MARKKRTVKIHKLRIRHKLSLEEIEESVGTATRKAKTKYAEMARVDLMKDETVVFLRSEKDVLNSLKSVLQKKAGKTKLSASTVTDAALKKAP